MADARKFQRNSGVIAVDLCTAGLAVTPKYFKAGKLSTAVATRQVEDRFIPLSPEEGDIYRQVETYISETYNAAAPEARNAVGFVMTIYRRRLASSFHALRQTMEKRKGGVGGLLTAADEARIDENVADQVEAGEEIDIETVSEDERRALAFEEIATIETIVDEIKRLPTDTKAMELSRVLSELKGSGYPQVMVFTQFTDTMDYLRELLVGGRKLRDVLFRPRWRSAKHRWHMDADHAR